MIPVEEGVEPPPEVGLGREPAADPDRKADFPRFRVGEGGDADIVDFGVGAPDPTARDRDLVLARKVVELGIPVEHPRRRVNEGRGVYDLVGVDAGQGAAGDIPRVVPARPHRGDPAPPEALKDLGEILNPHPVELDVLADGQVRDSPGVPFSEVGDRTELMREEESVWDPDAYHEVGDGLSFAALASDSARAIPLRVDSPPSKVRVEPLGGDGLVPITGEAENLLEMLPGIQLPLEPLDTLSLGLRQGLAHLAAPPKAKSRGRPLVGLGPLGLLSLLRLSPYCGGILIR